MKIHIRKPFFSAWQLYGWENGDYGIGINAKLVDNAIYGNDELFITIGNDKTIYKIKALRARSIALQYDSIYTARSGTKLYVIPRSSLTKNI